MPPRHPMPASAIPGIWLMTDERMGANLWSALEALPRGAGVIFRHHATKLQDRRRLFARVARIARRRALVLVRAGPDRLGRGEDGVHGSAVVKPGQLRSWSAHDRREALAGVRAGAQIVFISPVFCTRSHVGTPALGRLRAIAIGRGLPATLIALGGMNPQRFRQLRAGGFHGWAAIDHWLAAGEHHQKRSAVPT